MGLADRLSGRSEAWRPDLEDTHPNPLVGKVVEVETAEGDFGAYPLLFVLDSDGNEWRVHGFGSVLQKRIATLKPTIGDEIGIKFLGEEPARNYPGKTYRNYKIVLERGSGAKPDTPDWEAMAASAGDDDPDNESF